MLKTKKKKKNRKNLFADLLNKKYTTSIISKKIPILQ